MNAKLLTIGLILMVSSVPLTMAAENSLFPNSTSIDDAYTLKRNISAFDSVIEINDVMYEDYICGGNEQGAPGDDCTEDSSTVKGLYRETIENGTRFDLREITVTNYGTPHYVHLDVFVCYRMPVSNSAPNNLDCNQIANDLYQEEQETYTTKSHLGDEIFVYLIGREGSGGDQTKFGIKVERVSGEESNADRVEPRILDSTSVISDQVCQKSCDSSSDTDRSDAFTFMFHKGDSFTIEFWSMECESSSGNINFQIQVQLFVFRPSSPESPWKIERWSLNEQNCGRDDGYDTLSIINADEGGDLLLMFIATDGHGDGNPASYAVQLVEHDISSRDLYHDEDQDGFSDVQERECLTNYRYNQDTPTDTDGDTECDYLDDDDDGDGILDIEDLCPQEYYQQTTGEYGDHDDDGCQNIIDSDDDNDGVTDQQDTCPRGERNTTASPSNDFDDDGCLDVEDPDDDNDNWSDDSEQDCITNPMDASDYPLDLDGDLLCDYLDVDDDGDGVDDGSDSFPQDPLEWDDTDGDGIGNNADSDDDGDTIKDIDDAFPLDPTQTSDLDGDGCGDNPTGLNGDKFPNEPTQCSDTDGDGYGDNQDGILPDFFPNDATQWSDLDGDGFGDNPNGVNPDAFPMDPTQWSDQDGDGFGDNPNGNSPDVYPTDATQMADTDGDGYGDNPNGINGDSCPLVEGASYRDMYGCPDGDVDGWSDDGDDCPSKLGLSYFDRQGCADSDRDGFSDPDEFSAAHPVGHSDAFPFENSQSRDSDGDGYGDNISGQNPDNCLTSFGTSSIDRNGCSDQDGDGVSDDADAFPTEPSQWEDSDTDGYGDAQGGFEFDLCPDTYGNSTRETARGCPDQDGDGIRDGDDHCDEGKNQITNTKNTCFRAVFAGDANVFDAQGATILAILPFLYMLHVIMSGPTSENDEDTPPDSN